MKRVLIGSAFCLSLAAAAACSGTREGSDLEITGCLTANPQTQQFVLTAKTNQLSSLANRSAAGEAETYHYQLVGGNDLGSMVGKEVKVTGALVGKGKDVDAAAETTTQPAQRSDKDAVPVVETTEQIELQVEQLKVASIVPTGAECLLGR